MGMLTGHTNYVSGVTGSSSQSASRLDVYTPTRPEQRQRAQGSQGNKWDCLLDRKLQGPSPRNLRKTPVEKPAEEMKGKKKLVLLLRLIYASLRRNCCASMCSDAPSKPCWQPKFPPLPFPSEAARKQRTNTHTKQR